VADIKSEPRPASNRNRWPASYWNAWPASSESAAAYRDGQKSLYSERPTKTRAALTSLASTRSPSAAPRRSDRAYEEKITASYATRLVRLTFLAPDIVAAILAGKQPAGLTANKLMADTRLPLDWRDQRAALGFA
jgi:hypothetical protein